MLQIGSVVVKKVTVSEMIDMGYTIPDAQRMVDNNHVNDLVKYQLNRIREDSYLPIGVLKFAKTKETGDQLFVVDGQHRMRSMEHLYRTHSHNLEFFYMIYQFSTLDEITCLYSDHNKNTPVPDFSEYSVNSRAPAEHVAARLQNRYEDAWSTSKRPHRPSLNFTAVQQSLAWLFEKIGPMTASELETHVLRFNDSIKEMAKTGKFKNMSRPPTANMIAKARKWGMFLGLYKDDTSESYGYEWAALLAEKITGKTFCTMKKSHKRAVPKKIKLDSWNKYIGESVAKSKCICCQRETITMGKFVAGHIISEANGGTTTVDNILPICGPCNQSMGTRHMSEFVKTHYPENVSRFEKRSYDGKQGWMALLTTGR
jgi:hypothetical protein